MGKQLIEKIKYWLQLFLLPIYGFSFLFPRNKKIWLFGSTFGNRFAENPRYFYLYISQYRKTEITAIWISKDEKIVRLLTENGYKAYKKNSLKGIWYCLRGGTYLYDNYPKDISHFLSGGARKVNLWHGLPLKKIQRDNRYDFIRHPRNLIEKIKAIPRHLSDEKATHFVLTSSRFYEPIFSSAFGTKKVIVGGYPRCDIFTDNKIQNLLSEVEKNALAKIKKAKKEGWKIILYMPTFRDSEVEFFKTVQMKKLQEYLETNRYLLSVKLHCKSKLNKQFQDMESDNIYIISAEADPYCYIKDSDMLITDYSSIYFDYLLTENPILFFPYDYEEYSRKSREMYFDYEEFTPGKKVKTMEALQAEVGKILQGKEDIQYLEMREKMKRKVFNSQTGTFAAEELYRTLLKKEVQY